MVKVAGTLNQHLSLIWCQLYVVILKILAKHCIKFPDDGSLVIRNMLEQF